LFCCYFCLPLMYVYIVLRKFLVLYKKKYNFKLLFCCLLAHQLTERKKKYSNTFYYLCLGSLVADYSSMIKIYTFMKTKWILVMGNDRTYNKIMVPLMVIFAIHIYSGVWDRLQVSPLQTSLLKLTPRVQI
jgi:hypothetical protein